MFRILVADDEPTALQQMCFIIKNRCPEYEVVATAENGREGLQKIAEYRPDVLITDVKMPLVNGIELIQNAKEILPDLYSVVISGYQDFEYARGALVSGAVDYILKPVTPQAIADVMEKITLRLKERQSQKKNQLIRDISKGVSVDPVCLQQYFGEDRYYLALVRRNGLLRRFGKGTGIEVFSGVGEMMFAYGRDEMEALYICPADLLSSGAFCLLMKRNLEKMAINGDYVTEVLSTDLFRTAQLQETIQKLYYTLDNQSVVGVTQCIRLEVDMREWSWEKVGKQNFFNMLEHYADEGNCRKLQQTIDQFIQKCGEENCPQLFLEEIVRQIIFYLQKGGEYGKNTSIEYSLEDAFYYATTLDELMESLRFIFQSYIFHDKNYKIDTPEFLHTVKKDLKLHMSEEVTLQSICKKFAVSQSYLSRLFRKYENQTFNEYLTGLRVARAMELLETDKSMLVKDVAAMVGYKDQFYFSKIFRSVTGKMPSEWGMD